MTTDPIILPLTIANKEYSQVLPTRTGSIQARQSVDVKIGYSEGAIASGVYVTMKSGSPFYYNPRMISSQILYFACETAATDIEILPEHDEYHK